MINVVKSELEAHQKTIAAVIENLQPDILRACKMVVETINAGNKVLICGNGGSAADAQHIAAEFTGRYVKERRGLPAIALTTDTSALTAIGNDYAYDRVFDRQVESLAKPGDLVWGISSTGNSQNVLNAFTVGKEFGCKTLGFSGKTGGKFNGNCDLNIVVPDMITARVQEMHILMGHIVCQTVDDNCS